MRGQQAPPSPPGRILIVEDDSLTRELISAHLERLGFTAVAVGPSAAAIRDAVASAAPDDVVIVDIILGPDIDGFEVVRMLGKAGFGGRLLVVSGYGPEYLGTLSSLAAAMGLRIAGILEKPIRPADLAGCLLP